MKIALASPRTNRPGLGPSEAPPPLGILYVASVLEGSGQKVRVFDGRVEGITAEIRSFKPDVVGVTSTTPQFALAKNLIKQLKRELPTAFYVCGGVHVTALPEASLTELGIDCVVLGEGEYTMRELCEKLESGRSLEDVKGIAYLDQNEGKVTVNERRPLIEDLDDLPFPAWHLLDLEKYLVPPGPIRGLWLERCIHMICSRGCPYRCIFCGSNLIFGRRVRHRSVDNAIDEISLLIDEYCIDGVWFMDDTFTVDSRWVVEFSRALRRNRMNIKWGCQARVNTVSEPMLREMKQSGCSQLDFGVESGSAKVLKILTKDTDSMMVKDAFRLTRKLGLRALATFMIGNPGENIEDIAMTFKLAKEIAPDYVNFYYATPYPGTTLYDMAIKNGWIANMDYSDFLVRYEPVMNINFEKEALMKIRSRLQNAFLLRNFGAYLKNPIYISKILLLLLKYPKGIVEGFSALRKQGTLDDLAHAFLRYYWENRAKRLTGRSRIVEADAVE